MSNSNYAGFWLRFVAFIIDAIIVGIAQSFVVAPVLALFGISIASAAEGMQAGGANPEDFIPFFMALMSGMMVTMFVSYVISVLYFSLMESSKFQATLGKMALGLKVTDTDGNPLEIGKAFLRNIAKIISQMIMYIGYIMAGFTDKKQALHDMIAGTLVVKK